MNRLSSERAEDREPLLERTASAAESAALKGVVMARARIVNRTHRVVRERAQEMRTRRSRSRSLWIPMAICGAFVLILCTAIWSLLDQYEITPTGIPDASSQIFIFLLWFFPSSAALLALVWNRRPNFDADSSR